MYNHCESCTHKNVCMYKEHYEDVMELYKEAIKECGKYPWFRFTVDCIQYCEEKPIPKL